MKRRTLIALALIMASIPSGAQARGISFFEIFSGFDVCDQVKGGRNTIWVRPCWYGAGLSGPR